MHENTGAGTFFDGEEIDYLAEDPVWEATDEVSSRWPPPRHRFVHYDRLLLASSVSLNDGLSSRSVDAGRAGFYDRREGSLGEIDGRSGMCLCSWEVGIVCVWWLPVTPGLS